jgi:3-oxoacyl-[acyl-carrier-protein] synthase II
MTSPESLTVQSPLAITRLALLTPFGHASDTWAALRADRRLSDNTSVPDHFLDPDLSLDRSLRLALAAAARLAHESPLPPDTALFCGTSKGPITTFLSALDSLAATGHVTRDQAAHVARGTGAMAPALAHRLGLTAPLHTSVAACSSGLHALHRAARAIQYGEYPRALVVAADASLHPLFTGSFARLGVLAPPDASGHRRCDPFGQAGQGFFLTEAAAALLLEAAPSSPPLAFLDHTAIAADSSHLIAIDPHTRSLRRALHTAIADQPLAFIHAHATGTAHDAHELAALRAFAPNTHLFSHKRWLGHSLGAAGLVSLALSTLAHRHQTAPTGLPIPPNARSLTLAQGFGGHIALTLLRN